MCVLSDPCWENGMEIQSSSLNAAESVSALASFGRASNSLLSLKVWAETQALEPSVTPCSDAVLTRRLDALARFGKALFRLQRVGFNAILTLRHLQPF